MDQKLLTDFRSELLDSRFGAKAISTIAESGDAANLLI
ncbi:hypothetical protein UXETEC1_17110 [Escherichia coli]